MLLSINGSGVERICRLFRASAPSVADTRKGAATGSSEVGSSVGRAGVGRELASSISARGYCAGMFLAIFSLFAVATATRTYAQPIGTITDLGGSVAIQRGGGPIAPAVGAYVDKGDKITTGSQGRVSIVLTDHSEIDIGDSAAVILNEHGIGPGGHPHTRIGLLAGLVHALVNAAAGPNNFQINTPNAVASVRGTKFDASYGSGPPRQGYGACREFTDVAVYEGIVDVSGAAKPSAHRLLSAGYETTVACAGAPLAPAPIGVGGGRFSGISPGSMAAPPPPGASTAMPAAFPPVTIKPF